MKPDEIQNPDEIRTEDDALDQSIALNRIVMTMLQHQKETNKRIFIALIISLLMNLAIVGGFLWYESQWEYVDSGSTTTTTTTITQDTGEGTGNNVYQEGENATYNQGEGVE